MWAIIGYSLLGLLGLLILLLVLPVFVRVQYREELTVCVRVFGIPIYRYSSSDEKPKKPKKSKKKSTAKQKKKSEKKKDGFFAELAKDLKTEGISAVVGTIKAIAGLTVGAVKRVLRAVVVDRLQLQLFIASEDAAATAINTGRVCAVLYPPLTALQSVLRIRRREVTVTPDYLAEKGRVVADVRFHAIPIRILWAALWTVLNMGAVFDHKTKKTEEEQGDGK